MSSVVSTQSYRERRPASELGRCSAELFCEVGAMQVVGPQTGPLEHTLTPGTTVVGVRFNPGAAPSVLGLPASEVVDLSVGADELWGRSAVALGEAVAAATSPWEATRKSLKEDKPR
jgi:hypothetical protein